MKRLVLLLCVMVVVTVSAEAAAQLPGSLLPAGAVEVEHWEFDDGEWVFADSMVVPTPGRRSGGAVGAATGRADRGVTPSTALAQCVNWSVTEQGGLASAEARRLATDCIGFWVQSNNAVLIDHEGFSDLTRLRLVG